MLEQITMAFRRLDFTRSISSQFSARGPASARVRSVVVPQSGRHERASRFFIPTPPKSVLAIAPIFSSARWMAVSIPPKEKIGFYGPFATSASGFCNGP